MYEVPYMYKRIISSGNITAQWYGTITLTDGTEITFDYANITEQTGQITLKCSDQSEIGIGNAYAAQFSVQFKGLGVDRYRLFDGIIDLYSKILFYPYIETWGNISEYTWGEVSSLTWGTLNSGAIEYEFPMGQYIIKESMRTANDIKVTAYDFMILFDVDLPSQINSIAKLPYDWIALACSNCGVDFGLPRADALRMPNGNRMLKFSNANADVKTWRDVVAQAAEVMDGNAMMERDGNLTVRRYSNIAVDAITPGFRYSSDFSDFKSYYTGIYLSYREGGIADYQSNTTEQLDTGLAYDLGYNALLQISDTNARHRAMKEIINAHAGLNYVPFKVTMPFNPAYDLMDSLQFYGNQASEDDTAPITAITFRIGGKMDISCGGEDPSLQKVQSKNTKAIENISSNGGYLDEFWMVMGNAPDTQTTVAANTSTKIGEALFYAKEALSMLHVSYTASYVLASNSLVEAEVFVDQTSVYKTQENQLIGENRLTVTTGYEMSGKGDHKVSVYLTVKETTLPSQEVVNNGE